MPKDIHSLINGYHTFRQRYFGDQDTVYRRDGQQPKAMVIACVDSRVDPSLIFNSEPGDVLVVRNIANLIPPYQRRDDYEATSAALEFAVCHLAIPDIVILGHSRCAGIRSLCVPVQNDTFIRPWMQLAYPAYQQVKDRYPALDEQWDACAKQALLNSLANLHTFPWVHKSVQTGQLTLHAWYFDLATGIIHRFDPPSQRFQALA